MENILECTGLTKDYKGLRALDHLTFSVPDKGCIVGLLGPNGSGKTTLIKLLTGLLTPTEGNIRVGGMTVGTETKAIVAYLPDSNFLSDGFTVKQEVEYYKDFFPDFDEKKAECQAVYSRRAHRGRRSRRAGLYSQHHRFPQERGFDNDHLYAFDRRY